MHSDYLDIKKILNERFSYTTLTELACFLTIFNEVAYLTYMSIYHKALILFYIYCEISFELVP